MTTATGKQRWTWPAWLRKLARPRPFWQRRLEEQVERPGLGEFLAGLGRLVFDLLTTYVLAAIVIGAVVEVGIRHILFSPGFFEYGLADPLGRGFAALCVASGQCDLRYLMGGAVIGAEAVAVMLIMTHAATFGSRRFEDDAETITEAELITALAPVHETLVHLRADMVLAGVLPLSDEEKSEMEEVLKSTEPAQPTYSGPGPWPPAEMILAEMQAEPLHPYTRPELTPAAQEQAGRLASKLTNSKTMADIRKVFAALVCENQRLKLEVNEHRAARHYEALPTYEGQ